MAADIDAVYNAVRTLDETELEREVAALRAQQDKISRELARRVDLLELKRRWRDEQADRQLGIGDLRQRLSAPFAVESKASTDNAPRGTEAVRRVMREGGDWDVRKLHAELEQRGWLNPDAMHPLKATETSLNRLYKKYGEIERVGRGIYRYVGVSPHEGRLEA